MTVMCLQCEAKWTVIHFGYFICCCGNWFSVDLRHTKPTVGVVVVEEMA